MESKANDATARWTIDIQLDEQSNSCISVDNADFQITLFETCTQADIDYNFFKQNTFAENAIKDILELKNSLESIKLQLASQTEKINSKKSDKVEEIEERLNKKIQLLVNKRSHSTHYNLDCKIF